MQIPGRAARSVAVAVEPAPPQAGKPTRPGSSRSIGGPVVNPAPTSAARAPRGFTPIADIPPDPRAFSRNHAPLPRLKMPPMAHLMNRPATPVRGNYVSGTRLPGPPIGQLTRSVADRKQNTGTVIQQFFARHPESVPASRKSPRAAPPQGARGILNARTTSSVDTSQTNVTGINHWWSYEEGDIPGVGRWMINAHLQNLLIQSDDMTVPHRGVDLAFRRTYNSFSNHDFAGDDGAAEVGQYGNGWTNTFDAHMSTNNCPNTGYSWGGFYGFSVHDIDGARYDYCFNSSGQLVAPIGMQGTSLVANSDGGSFIWTKKNGTTYWFYAPYYSGSSAAYSGRIYRISSRNPSSFIQFTYAWSPDASSSANLTNIYAATDNGGLQAVLAFSFFNGQKLLSQLTRPDGVAIAYGYDGSGNLLFVDKPGPNNSATPARQSYGGYHSNLTVSNARWNASYNPSTNSASDGGYVAFAQGGLGNAQTTAISWGGVVNFAPADGTNANLQPGISTGVMQYRYEGIGSAPTYTSFWDTDGHSVVQYLDVSGPLGDTGRPTVRFEYTGSQWLSMAESWDGYNELTSSIDARGNQTDYAYDVDGNAVAVAAPSPTSGAFRPTSLYSYDVHDNLVAYCDPNAVHAMQADWTSAPIAPLPGQGGLCPTQSTAAMRYQWVVTPTQPFGKLQSSTSPATPSAPSGYQTTYAYLAAQQGGGNIAYGLPTSVTGAAISQNDTSTPTRQPQQSFWYDANGNLICYGTGNGQWLLTYDSLGRLTSASDPDDSSTGTGACGKTGAQPGWSTTARTTYFSDGTVASKQSASQAANGTSTSFTYDVDGNPLTELHHFGCATVSGCTASVTQKFYDGADRLVEVQQPSDAWDVQSYPWSTRYIYDLSLGGTTPYRGMGLLGHGNLVSTQELLSGTVWKPSGSSYPISTGSWTDVRASAYDAFDRVTSQFEAAFGDIAKNQNNYDGPNTAGLLATTRRATGEIRTNSYDAAGRLTDATYSGDGGVTPATHLSYDAAGHVTSRSTAVLGAQVLQYDAAGAVTSIAEPAALGGGAVGYDYYADGVRKDVTYQSSANPLTTVSQYTYRNDGKRLGLQLANGSRFAWTYTAAGREQTQSDPLTGVSIAPSASFTIGKGGPHPFYPASMTYVARSVSYDTFGRVSGLTLPPGLFSYSYGTTQYDLDDSVIEESRHVYQQSGSGQPAPVIKPVCEISNIRNEKVPNGAQSSCSSFLNLVPHNDLNGTWLSQPGDVWGSGWWTVDGRSGVRLNNLSTDVNGVSVGSQYLYDASGRITNEFKGADKACPPGYAYASSTLLNPYCYTYGTRTKTYDAENRLVTDTYPYADPNRPMQTSYGTSYGDYWMDLSRFYQPANISGVDYDADGHPARISLYHPDANLTQTLRWIWDGNDRFLQCQVVNGQCTGLTYSLEGLADYDPQTNLLAVYDRNVSGSVATYHTSTRFGSWTDSFGGPAMSPRNANDICSDGDAGDSTTCDPLRSGKLTRDGWTIENDTWQGVRTSDLSIGQWNTPDAYAGEVHDPMSQKPFMWNRNNPYVYSDPSGYDPAGDRAKAVLNFLVLDDWRTAKDSKASGLARTLAVASLLSNLGGPEVKGGQFALKAIIKISEEQLAHVAEKHFVESSVKASKFAAGTAQSDVKGMVQHAIEGAGPNNISWSTSVEGETNIKILTDFGHTIGTANKKDTSLMASYYDLQGNFLTAFPVKK